MLYAFTGSFYISSEPFLSMHFSQYVQYFNHFVLPLTISPSQYRAILCQRCGVGTSHLLLLQRDSHGVQLPGEGIAVILMKYPLFLLNSLVHSEHLLKGL